MYLYVMESNIIFIYIIKQLTCYFFRYLFSEKSEKRKNRDNNAIKKIK